MATPTQIEPSADYLKFLRGFVHPVDELQKGGFTVAPLTEEALLAKRRCVRCGTRQKKHVRNKKPQKSEDATNHDKENNGSTSTNATTTRDSAFTLTEKIDGEDKPRGKQNGDTHGDTKEHGFPCVFHTGKLQFNRQSGFQMWTCCKQARSAKPCSAAKKHEMNDIPLYDLAQHWQCHPTPQVPVQSGSMSVGFPLLSKAGSVSFGSNHHNNSGSRRQRKRAASTQDQTPKRLAVAIDCEMGTSFDNDSELIRITLIDYFTGDVLLDSLVWPSVSMMHYNTRFSGVTRNQIYEARRMRQCIEGVEAARARVWQFVGPETVVVGHGTQNDLATLRWVHNTVVDSFPIENKLREAYKRAQEEEKAKKKEEEEARKRELGIVEEGSKDGTGKEEGEQNKDGDISDKKKEKSQKRGQGGLSLKALVYNRLGRVIQTGNKGHDSFEDALSARDLVDWHIRQAMNGVEVKWEAPTDDTGAK